MNNFIHETADIKDYVKMGNNIEILENCVIGTEGTVFDGFKRIKSDFGVRLGNHIFIGAGSVIVRGSERDTYLGNYIIMAPLVMIGHDCIIKDRVRIMNNVSLNGFVEVGKYVTIEPMTVVRNRRKIGDNSIIGMGSNVVKDIPSNVVAYGNPCRVIRKRDGLIKNLFKKVFV